MREMKNSGVEWIGEIPAEWNLIRFRFIADIETGNQDTQNAVPDGQYPFYVRSPIIERSNNYTFEGDGILMAGDGAGAGRVFHFASGKYAVHQRVYHFSKFKYIKHELLKHYLENLFATVMDYGSAKTTVPSVRLPMIQDFNVCVPPISEQEKIIVYINEKCAQVDTLISNEEQQIEKLKAYKQSIITETVTKGLNPDVAMKDSGVEWIGEIPNHWKIIGLSKLFDYIGGYAFNSNMYIGEGNNQIIRIGNVKNEGLLLDSNPVFINNEIAHEAENVAVKPNMILFTMTGTKGKRDYFFTYLVKQNDLINRNLYINQRVGAFVKKRDISLCYYCYLLKSKPILDSIFVYETGTANQGNLGIEKISRTLLHFPPQEEQKEIAAYLDERCTQIDHLISIKQAKIEKLTQYKKSLIYEYVTGKKEVE